MNLACVLLANPAFYRILGSSNNLVRLQQAALSAVLSRAGHEVYQYNADADLPENLRGWQTLYATPIEQYKAVVKTRDHKIWREAEEVIDKIHPDVVGVTVFSGCIEQAARLSEICRERNIKVLAGGSHPTTVGNLKLGGLDQTPGKTALTPADLHMKGEWDGVCIGDGEDAILKFVEGEWDGVCLAGNIAHLDSYPPPQRNNYVGPSWFRQEMLEKGALLTSRGCRYRCLPALSKVYTPHGDIPITNLGVGDEVVSNQGISIVTMLHDFGIDETVRIQTDNGTLECTADHPLFTKRGWIRAASLTVDDEVLCPGAP